MGGREWQGVLSLPPCLSPLREEEREEEKGEEWGDCL